MDQPHDELGPADNRNVDLGGLPTLDDMAFLPLDPAYLRVRTLTSVGVAATAAAIGIGLIAMATSTVTVIVAAVAFVVVALGCWLHRLEVTYMGYLIREQDLSFRSGVIGRSVATVPFGRVQHVSIGRGPLDRQFGLASLQVRTAGGAIGVPGLPHETAERLKQLVTARAAELADAEVPDEHGAEPVAVTGLDQLPPPPVPGVPIDDDG